MLLSIDDWEDFKKRVQQDLVLIDQSAVVASDTQGPSPGWLQRLSDLADHVAQDLALLKEYEDALRYEDDPRRRARYRREIEQLRESAARYQREYDELRGWVAGEPPAAMSGVADLLQQMNAKLDAFQTSLGAIQEGLADLRQAVLARFDASEQKIISTVVRQLDQSQLIIVEAVLDALEADRLPEAEARQVSDATGQAIGELQQKGLLRDQQVAEIITRPALDMKHKLKIMVPIIPMILSYEGEVELKSGLDLETVWQRLIYKIRGQQ